MSVPSPATAPSFTAEQLIRRIRRRGGRVLRMREWGVFVLTTDADLATWLYSLGAKPYSPRGGTPIGIRPFGGYKRAKEGPIEWDLYIHAIPVAGAKTVWEAAGELEVETVDAEEVA